MIENAVCGRVRFPAAGVGAELREMDRKCASLPPNGSLTVAPGVNC